jgi:hypothetical protein
MLQRTKDECTERLKNMQFKLTSKSFTENMNTGNTNFNDDRLKINKTPLKGNILSGAESVFSSFNSFSFNNNSNNNMLNYSIKNNDNEVEYYKKKCSVLEGNMKELSVNYAKNLTELKGKILDRDTEDICKANSINGVNKSELDDYLRKSSASKKKQLTPINSIKSSSNKNNSKYNY